MIHWCCRCLRARASRTALNLTVNATQPQYWGGLALDMKGNLWAPDLLNNQVVKVTQFAPGINFGYIFLGWGILGPQTLPVYNYGNANLNIYGLILPEYFSQSGGTCLTGTSVAPGSSCTLVDCQHDDHLGSNAPSTRTSTFVTTKGMRPSASPHLDTIVVTGGSIF